MPSPAVGQPAPDFALEGVAAGERKTFSLADAKGGPLVLAFYPGDDTPVCTRQLCSYQDDLAELTGLGATLWGISPQDLVSHETFAQKRGLSFPLLADPQRQAIKAYGVNGPLGHTKRSVFVLDGAGVVRWAHVSALGLTYQDTQKIAAAVQAL
ncbi:MAG: alkyl hydroperoxide reductase/Thiol specific antioxidant/Mal allergen [Frankiales bacterium]|jgi:peroxiredoxin Q/BCP|nr:alkyl hydroperoxide reductase/Thiol specific antioxidant/Mal allergen [Frankiales bacterium]